MNKLYIENSVGRRVTEALRKFQNYHGWDARFQHDLHPQMQERQQNGDSWWIREVTAAGFAIVTCDLAIVSNPDERACVDDVQAQIVGFGKADYNAWEMMRALSRHWLSIQGHLEQRPQILRVWAGSKAPQSLI